MSAGASLAGKTIVLGVTGSIAAFKAVVLARRLVERGATVLPVLTAGAARFVGPVTFSGITGQTVATDMWDPAFAGEMHVALADRADLVVVAPATADFLARMAQGRADDLLGALVLCARGPVVAAPAMHPRMWDHPAVRASVATLTGEAWGGRVTLVGPVSGKVASGDVGLGRMTEPEEIAWAIETLLRPREEGSGAARDLQGRHIVVSAGPTQEAIDPVRYLGNRSSGKMGFALAERAAARGARVTLVAGPVSLPTPAGVERIDVVSAAEMQKALDRALAGTGGSAGPADALVMAAAVADFRPLQASAIKWKKGHSPSAVQLVENPDLLATLGARRGDATRPVLVGFALETGDQAHVVAEARAKRAKKKVDLVVANAADVALGGDATEITLVDAAGETPVTPRSKRDMADVILDRVRGLLASP